MARSKREDVGSSTSLPKCASCKRDLGKDVGIIPFFVDDCASMPGERAKHEAFCPQCFVYVRSPREPSRWLPGCFIPMICGSCKVESVAIGQERCGHCRDGGPVFLLPPVEGIC